MSDEFTRKLSNFNNSDIEDVISIAEELVQENKVIQIDILYKRAKRKLKLPSDVLLSIIDLLIKEKIIVEGSKLIKRDILINKYRKDIYDCIKAYPGVHFSIIKKKIFPNKEGSAGQFIWHLNILKKFNYIKQLEVKNYSLFIPYEMEDDIGITFFLVRERINFKILKYLCEDPVIEQARIPEKIDESRGSVYYHVKTLSEFEIVKIEKNPNSRGHKILLNPEKEEFFKKVIEIIDNNKL